MYFKTLRTSDAGVLTPPFRRGVLLVPIRCNPVCGTWQEKNLGEEEVRWKISTGTWCKRDDRMAHKTIYVSLDIV